jgi:hypothetical protein
MNRQNEQGENVCKILLQAFGLLLLASLITQQAYAGASITAEFNTFVFDAAGPIEELGAGEFQQSTMLSTTFGIAGGEVGDFSLGLVFTGPGTFNPDTITLDGMICTEQGECTFNGMFDFEAPMIAAGTIYTATGNIFHATIQTSIATATDSFVASVPEPAVFALIAAGLFGIAFTRRKTAC